MKSVPHAIIAIDAQPNQMPQMADGMCQCPMAGWGIFGMVLVGLLVLAVIGTLFALTFFLIRKAGPGT